MTYLCHIPVNQLLFFNDMSYTLSYMRMLGIHLLELFCIPLHSIENQSLFESGTTP